MEPRYISSVAKHVRTRGQAVMGAHRMPLLVLFLPLPGIAMYVERLFMMPINLFFLHVHDSSFVITDPSIQMARRPTISVARHVQGARTVHKEGLQLEVVVIVLVKVPFFSSPVRIIVYTSLSCLSSSWMSESTP
jgi:hypothetical protein